MLPNKITPGGVYIACCLLLLGCGDQALQMQTPPNILWITSEDMTTMLGAYGDPAAHTPHLDSLAEISKLYTQAYATAPVCSPSRSCIITGFYATSLGSQHLRSHVEIPDEIVPFPKYLRKAGYFTTNNSKEDYNFTDTTIWDESSAKAHWRHRSPGQPFFSVFNLGLTHQSSIFGSDSVYLARVGDYLPRVKITRPEEVQLPAYYPDDPEIRKLWARYYTNVSIIDYQVNEILRELAADGLSDSTVVFYYSDHGTGMPRSKRAAYDSGLKIPLLVHVPQPYAKQFNFSPGPDSTMVSFIDFAPTVLELAGVDLPAHYIGRPFLSADQILVRDYVFGTSDRVDEGYELSRTVRSSRYRYIRNYLPHLALLQPNFYTDQSEIMQALERFRDSDTLTPAQSILFRESRTPEELYDTQSDPDEVVNLAYDPDYVEVLQRHRSRLEETILKTHDTGFMPEPAMIRLTREGETPYALARNDSLFPLIRILEVCHLMRKEQRPKASLLQGLNDRNPFVRYWAVVVAEQKDHLQGEVRNKLEQLLNDPLPEVQVEAAKVLVQQGNIQAVSTIIRHMQTEEKPLRLFASRAFQEVAAELPGLPKDARQVFEEVSEITQQGNMRISNYYDLYAYWALQEVFN